MMSLSFIIRRSLPSILTSVPDHLPKSIVSPSLTSSGWIFPESSLAPEPTAVGSGARDDSGKIQPLDVKEGDTILFGKWSGTEVKIDGKDLLIMKESDIMGIIN